MSRSGGQSAARSTVFKSPSKPLIIDKSKASPLFTQKFLMRELEIWPRLRHRHIVQVERMFQIQDRIYVFMELAPGGSVIEYVQR
ncbi:hypothetical protein TNCV_1212801 [Trichonephila clavipes]|nr:hypothetical protein TNCV_1212801 [Trichonephila clavipes]